MSTSPAIGPHLAKVRAAVNALEDVQAWCPGLEPREREALEAAEAVLVFLEMRYEQTGQ